MGIGQCLSDLADPRVLFDPYLSPCQTWYITLTDRGVSVSKIDLDHNYPELHACAGDYILSQSPYTSLI